MKILYLEDDIILSETVAEFLSDEGFELLCVYDGDEALEAIYKSNFDMLLLDVNVPHISGFKLLSELRGANISTPAIFTTSLQGIEDLSSGYNAGADDYIKKPFALKELLFRIKALLKREYKTQNEVTQIRQNIHFNMLANELILHDKKVLLHPKEILLLKLFLKHKNECVSFEEIYQNVWPFEAIHSEMSLRTYIKNLRKHLGKEMILSIKKWGTNLYKSEKQTIFYVLGLYLSSTLLLIFTLFGSYYLYKLDERVHSEKKILKEYSLELEDKLLLVHENSDTKYEYPRFKHFQSAIYDIDKNLIFSTLQKPVKNLQKDLFFQDGNVYYIALIKPYYMGAAYAVIEKKEEPLNIMSDLILAALLVVFITLLTSFFLVKLVLKPLRSTLHLLDNFIKETTHELNTPITTILTNIERLESAECDEKSMKKLQRIKTASTTISNIYQDLVYLLLNHQVSSQNETLNLSEIVQQRVHYFLDMANAKKLTLHTSLQENVLFFADKQKMQRLVDNILSNAIKYTNRATLIAVTLTDSSLVIEDEGKGMSQEELSRIFERYSRFDKTQGGFGIGYSIVKSITDEYGINITIDSQVNKGTKVTLTW